MGLDTDTISAERAAMEIVQIQPSNSRSVLASMNDFVATDREIHVAGPNRCPARSLTSDCTATENSLSLTRKTWMVVSLFTVG